jgi:hypothetical protein
VKDVNVQSDSTLLSRFPFIGHGNPYNNLDSLCILLYMQVYYKKMS